MDRSNQKWLTVVEKFLDRTARIRCRGVRGMQKEWTSIEAANSLKGTFRKHAKSLHKTGSRVKLSMGNAKKIIRAS
jgi:hypothetical protein